MQMISFDIVRMIELRKLGWAYSALAREFGKDHTTIMYHCRRLGLGTKDEERKTLIEKGMREYELRNNVRWGQKARKVYKYDYLLMEENVNPGKSYKEYLTESLRRPVEKRYYEIYHTDYGITKLASSPEEERGEDYEPDRVGLDEVTL